MTLLVTGASGQLGTALRSVLPTDTLYSTRAGALPLDLANPSSLAIALDHLQPDIIVNAAAYTAVDAAEADESQAFAINAEAVGAIGDWAARRGAFVVHVSTDYVFDGEGTAPYREDHPISPVNAYGRSKAAGELALRESGARHAVLRTSWLYGASGHNFMLTMLRLARERSHLRVVNDQVGSPTTVQALASAIARLIENAARLDDTAAGGTFHVACRGETTWHGFAEAILSGAAARRLIARKPEIEPVETAAFPTPARRPRYSVLDPSHFEQTFNLPLPAWQSALEDTLDRLNP